MQNRKSSVNGYFFSLKSPTLLYKIFDHIITLLAKSQEKGEDGLILTTSLAGASTSFFGFFPIFYDWYSKYIIFHNI